MQCKQIKIFGVVQGVGYRAWVKRMADQLKIKGYVRNAEDGSVEIVACDNNTVDVFVNICSKGPATAFVKKVIVSEIIFNCEEGFEIWV